MSTLTTLAAITPDTKIGDLVAAHPGFARIFEKLDIDYCCGGKQTLAVACARRSLDANTASALLAAFGRNPVRGPSEIDTSHLTLSQLADHIEETHHAYVKAELPRLLEMAERVARKHESRDARLAEVAGTLRELTAEMLSHMQKEELVLFPLVREIDAGPDSGIGVPSGSIANPIRQMEAEHDSAGKAVARLRQLTDGFQPPAEACNTHRALLAGIADFESDLHRHVHKENNILFPRALAVGSSQ